MRTRSVATVAALALTVACAADGVAPPTSLTIPQEPSLLRQGGDAALIAHNSKEGIAGQYVVVLDDATDATTMVREHAIAPLQTYDAAIHGFAARLDQAQLAMVRRDARVKYVEQDMKLYLPKGAQRAAPAGAATASGGVAPQGVQPGAMWGLDRLDQASLPLDGIYRYTGTGAGVTVYIMSSGIRYTHAEFDGVSANRAAVGKDFVVPSLNGNDCLGYGTRAAATAGGTTFGVARGAKLRSVRIWDCFGSSDNSTVLAAINWITYNHVNPAVAWYDGASAIVVPSINDAIRKSVLHGVTWVLPSGDQTRDACGISPASEPLALVVGATDMNDVRSASSTFGGASNFGPCIDLFAPGDGITSADFSSDVASSTVSGSWAGSPLVAGLAALFLQARPTATPTEVLNVLRSGAQPGYVGNPGAGSPNLLASKQNGTCTAVGFCTGAAGQTSWPRLGSTDYYFTNPGVHRGWLRGTPGTNFDLALYEWSGAAWVQKASKSTASTNEALVYSSALSANYMYRVKSTLGTGTFDVWVERP